MDRTLIELIAARIVARANCLKTGNTEWYERHKDGADKLCRALCPSGSGIDGGTSIDWQASKVDRVVFNTAFHHMNGDGFYDGWTYHNVVVTPTLVGRINIKITGGDRNQVKDYLADQYNYALTATVPREEEERITGKGTKL